jgi:hypothetical protein
MTTLLYYPTRLDDVTHRQFLIGKKSLAVLLLGCVTTEQKPVEGLTPQLAAALNGNPTTTVGQR